MPFGGVKQSGAGLPRTARAVSKRSSAGRPCAARIAPAAQPQNKTLIPSCTCRDELTVRVTLPAVASGASF